MAVTPLVATHRLVIDYDSDLPHKIQFLCSAVEVSGSWFLKQKSGTNIAIITAITNLLTFLPGDFYTGTTFIDAILQQYSNGAYVEVYADTVSANGASTIVTGIANQITYVFRDATNKRVGLRELGVNDFAQPFKVGYSGLSGASLALVNEFLNTADGHVGAWWQGRAGQPPVRFVAVTGSLNRKSRRRKGIV